MRRLLIVLLTLTLLSGCSETSEVGEPSPQESPSAVTASPTERIPTEEISPPAATPDSAQGDVLEVDAPQDEGVK